MNNFRKYIICAALISLIPLEAQAQAYDSLPLAKLVASATVFAPTPMRCTPARDAITISQLQIFIGNTPSDRFHDIHVETTERVNGVDITMSCNVSAENLKVLFTAEGYSPVSYIAKWC